MVIATTIFYTQSMDGAYTKYIGIFLLALVVLGAFFWYWQSRKEPLLPQEEKPASIGAQIFDQVQNPTDNKFPETNPFAVNTNPFSAHTNPLKDVYKNPFR